MRQLLIAPVIIAIMMAVCVERAVTLTLRHNHEVEAIKTISPQDKKRIRRQMTLCSTDQCAKAVLTAYVLQLGAISR